MLPFASGDEDIKGYVDGHISRFMAQEVISRIRRMVEDILKAKLGTELLTAGKELKARRVQGFDRDICLFHGIKSMPAVSAGEVKVDNTKEGNNESFFERLSIAAPGYLFTDEAMVKRIGMHHIPLDTDGQWIRRLLGRKQEGRRLIAIDQEDDGRIILGTRNRKRSDRVYKGCFAHESHFLPVARELPKWPDVGDFEQVMAIVLRVHNVLYAVHSTCLDKPDLFKWSLTEGNL